MFTTGVSCDHYYKFFGSIFSWRYISLFCFSQILTLARKIRAKWGDFNATDSDETDTPNWGFLNMKKLGHIALGIAKEELRDLPIRGIEDAIDVLGQQKDWDRGQVPIRVEIAASSISHRKVLHNLLH